MKKVVAVLIGLFLVAIAAAVIAASDADTSSATARADWGGRGHLVVKDFSDQFDYAIVSYESTNVDWFVHADDIWLSVLNYDWKPVTDGPHLRLGPGVKGILQPELKAAGMVLSIPLVLDTRDAKPGMYVLRASTRAYLGRPVNGISRTRPLQAFLLDIYVPPTPDKQPALEAGQRFMSVPGFWDAKAKVRTEPTAYRGVSTNTTVTWEHVLAKVFTLKRTDGKRLVFSLEDYPEDVYIEGDYTATSLPDLTPLLEDDIVRTLKAKYEGRQVWCYTGPGGRCVWFRPEEYADMFGPVTLPLRIKRIERFLRKHETLGFNGTAYQGYSFFETSNPLFVITDMPKRLRLGHWYHARPPIAYKEGEDISVYADKLNEYETKAQAEVERDIAKYCGGLWMMAADQWDFERIYSLQPPWEQHPEWPKKMQEAIKKGELVKGMTPEMVVWVLGYPTAYGSMERLKKWDRWPYEGGPVKEPRAIFKNGKFVEMYSPPSP